MPICALSSVFHSEWQQDWLVSQWYRWGYFRGRFPEIHRKLVRYVGVYLTGGLMEDVELSVRIVETNKWVTKLE